MDSMNTLLLRLAGPMQSWGLQSRFTERDTAMEPSKSGTIGLLCAALGRPRDADVSDLARLQMGVRVDREGIMKHDYQTALDVIKANLKDRDTVVSTRYYIADAVFLVGLSGETGLLIDVERALARPRWQLYLGRKSYLPSLPVRLTVRPRGMAGPADAPGIVELPLDEALRAFPLLCNGASRKGGASTGKLEPDRQKLRLVLEDPAGPIPLQDVPVSFSTREFSTRRVRIDWMEVDQNNTQSYRAIEFDRDNGGKDDVPDEDTPEST